MKQLTLLLSIVIFASCSHKIRTERTFSESVDSTAKIIAIKDSVQVTDSATAKIPASEVKEAIENHKEVKSETISRGIKVVIKIDSTGKVTCESKIDSLLHVNDSITTWNRDHNYREVVTNTVNVCQSDWHIFLKYWFWLTISFIGIFTGIKYFFRK